MSERGEFIGIICDGDRTWAMKKHGVTDKNDLSKNQLREGYSSGANAVEKIMDTGVTEEVEILAFWGLSDKNMTQRTEENLRVLFDVFHEFFRRILEQWIDRDENKNIRVIHLGESLHGLPNFADTTRDALQELIVSTQERTGKIIAFCLNYNGNKERDEAIQHWAKNQIGIFQDYLNIPKTINRPFQPLDGIIRTGVPLGQSLRRGNFLIGYEDRYDTAYVTNALTMPEYAPEAFVSDLQMIRRNKMKEAGS